MLDKAYPTDTAIKVIHDNHSAHISKETKAWLAQQPAGRFEFTFTPKHGNRPMRAARSSGSSGCAFRVNGWRPVPGKKLMEPCNEMIVDAREVLDAAKYLGTRRTASSRRPCLAAISAYSWEHAR
ncbi:MAG: hypothetical protein ACLPSW_30650 [Roseiarcus sp.]